MTDETEKPIEVIDPKPATGSVTISIPEPVSPSPVVTAPITVGALPIEHKETFWGIAKEDVEAAIQWLRTELAKL